MKKILAGLLLVLSLTFMSFSSAPDSSQAKERTFEKVYTLYGSWYGSQAERLGAYYGSCAALVLQNATIISSDFTSKQACAECGTEYSYEIKYYFMVVLDENNLILPNPSPYPTYTEHATKNYVHVFDGNEYKYSYKKGEPSKTFKIRCISQCGLASSDAANAFVAGSTMAIVTMGMGTVTDTDTFYLSSSNGWCAFIWYNDAVS